MAGKLDNSTYQHKLALRRRALALLTEVGIEQPVVMETHGGRGELFKACYEHLPEGVVFETDNQKAAHLGKQRPTWAVYQADCVHALSGGVGAHLTVDLLDCDPYGEPWPVLEAFFTSQRSFAPVMAVAVNDGLRQKLAMGGAWDVASLQDAVQKHGNDLHPIYLEVCRELLEEKVAHVGYQVSYFGGYYTGAKQAMTHYLAMLRRDA